MGEVVGLAAALQARPRPGSALVGPVTRAAVEHLFSWGPSTAGPVSIPIRTCPSAVTARKAARAARSGSSSCASGAPNTAWSPEPDTDVTVPPSVSTSAITVFRLRVTASRRVSGSSSAGTATSAERMLTVLSSSCGEAGGAAGAWAWAVSKAAAA